MADIAIPLVVDLDGTLIKDDLLVIATKKLFKKNIFYVFYFIIWLIRGRALLKEKLFNIIKLSPDELNYNTDVLDFVKNEFKNGRKIILATASLKYLASNIATYCAVFSDVFGTENNINLKGINKRDLLVKKFGVKKFDYIGNSMDDLIIFKSCRYAFLVKPTEILERKSKKIGIVKKIWR